MAKKGLFTAAAAFAASPMGRPRIGQTKAYVQSPQGRAKINHQNPPPPPPLRFSAG